MCMSFCISIFKKFRSSRNQGNGLVSYSAPFIPRTAFQCCRFHSFATRMTKVTHSNSLTYMKMWRNGEGFGDATQKGLWETGVIRWGNIRAFENGVERQGISPGIGVCDSTNKHTKYPQRSLQQFDESQTTFQIFFLSHLFHLFWRQSMRFSSSGETTCALATKTLMNRAWAAWDTTVGA